VNERFLQPDEDKAILLVHVGMELNHFHLVDDMIFESGIGGGHFMFPRFGCDVPC
jgi:hypothetical protein